MDSDFAGTIGAMAPSAIVLDGYFDDSGTHDSSEAVTVAGYLSTHEQWELFERAWLTALQEWGLPYFHMTDFANCVAPFANWSEQERRFRLAYLLKLVNVHSLASVGACFSKKVFDRVFTREAKRFVGGAYGVASTVCFMEAAKLLKDGYPSARIAYTFERGSKGASEVQKVFDWNLSDLEQRGILRLESLRFRNKSTAQLQAADILAYELYRLLPHMLGSKNRPRRTEILSMLAECKPRSWIALDERELTKFAQVSAAAAAYHGTSRKPKRSGR